MVPGNSSVVTTATAATNGSSNRMTTTTGQLQGAQPTLMMYTLAGVNNLIQPRQARPFLPADTTGMGNHQSLLLPRLPTTTAAAEAAAIYECPTPKFSLAQIVAGTREFTDGPAAVSLYGYFAHSAGFPATSALATAGVACSTIC